MKRFNCFLLSAYLLLIICPSKSYGQKLDGVTGDPMEENVDLRLDNSTVDEHLIELARASKVNFIADATRFPTAPDALDVKLHGVLGNLMLAMACQRHLTWTKADKGTFLFWADWQGDLTALAKPILAQEQGRVAKLRQLQEAAQAAMQAKNLQAQQKSLEDMKLHHLRGAARATDYWAQEKSLEQDILPDLARYFKATQGWDGVNPTFTVGVKFTDLPPDLRAKVMAKCRDELFNPDRWTAYATFFDDAFWDKALLRDSGYSGRVPGWLEKMHDAQYVKSTRELELRGSGSLNRAVEWTFAWYSK